MAVTYSIREGLLRMECVGTYPAEELLRQFRAAMSDPDCPPRVALLLDVSRSASLASRPADEIRKVAEYLGPFAERIGGRCAVVAGGDVQFGLSQMGAIFSEDVGVETRVFRTDEAATEWLKTAAR